MHALTVRPGGSSRTGPDGTRLTGVARGDRAAHGRARYTAAGVHGCAQAAHAAPPGHDFARIHVRRSPAPQSSQGLAVDPADAAAEQEARHVASEVVRAAATPAWPVRGPLPPATRAVLPSGSMPPGAELDAETRAFMEPRFGHDFGRVRVHTGSAPAIAARALEARAFTIGSDIFFAAGAYAPRSTHGRELLAHELTHTLQQTRQRPVVQRAPDEAAAAADPICGSFDFNVTFGLLLAQVSAYLGSKDAEQRLALIRSLKRILRCATEEQQEETRTDMEGRLGAADTAKIFAEAATAFGGYTGMYPGYAPDIRKKLEKLGTSETVAMGGFELSGSGAKHRKGAKRVAGPAKTALGRTDILYFRGHQFAQYRAPGMFSNGAETRGFDLRYIDQAGGFPNVKLLISTSCATLCKEAFDVFHGLFPNAVILGYRKSAPLEGGKVRAALQSRITKLGRPLLLEESVDIGAVISAWKAVIEERHKGDTAQLPGFWDGTTLHFWDGAAWGTIGASDATNTCRKKGDFRGQYPAP